jgi:putative membrane protein
MTKRDDPPRPDPKPGEEPNHFALDRTVLANERTYTAWIRTGLTALAAGVAFEKFMADVIPHWGTLTIAVILIAFSGVAFFVAAWRYTHLGIRLGREDVKRVPLTVTMGTSLILIACALIALVGLWTMAPALHP